MQTRQAQHVFLRRHSDADFHQVGAVHAGEYGDSDQQRALAVLRQCLGRGFHHAAATAGVHVHHPHPGFGGHLAGVRHGVGDVVELEVQEHLEAACGQLLQQLRAGGGKQLLAYLQAALRGVETGSKRQGGIGGGEVQRHQYRRVNVGRKAVCHQRIHVFLSFLSRIRFSGFPSGWA